MDIEYTHNGILFSHKKNNTLSDVADKWMELEDITLRNKADTE
jgi:hypothetical protein